MIKDKIFSFLKDALIIGMASAFLWDFSNIVRYGTHTIQEPSTPILISEVILLVCILGFGIFTFTRDLNKEG